MSKAILFAAIFFGLASIGLMVSTIILSQKEPKTIIKIVAAVETKQGSGVGVASNECEGKKPKAGFDNLECTVGGDSTVPPQSGSNVTKGYEGEFVDTTEATAGEPLRVPYFTKGLCPVNVHWHLGTEHISMGEYDEDGSGPTHVDHRRKLAGKARKGGQCHSYDKTNSIFTEHYDWKHCVDMEVGQTYEVHWPHSVFGACNTPDQYQEPFYDGVFCRYGALKDEIKKNLEDGRTLPEMVGVQAQVFVIVNDEDYYYPNLIDGMIVEGGSGKDMAYYTGSTTGTSRNNTICSKYGPITWQVDRTCNKISASSFDKMCADMKSKKDPTLKKDLYAHGSRIVVSDDLSSYNDNTGN